MNERMTGRAVLALALVAFSAPAFAQSAPDDDASGPEWTVVAPPASSTVTAPGGDTVEGGFSGADRIKFVEKLRDRVLDQLCRQLKLKFDYNFGMDDFAGTGLGTERYLGQLPDGKLTLVDIETLRVGAGHTFPWEIAQGLTAGLWIGSHVDGKSMVVRPLGGTKTCSEVDRLIDLRDIKTVLPFNAKRVLEMKTGELWRVPFTVTVGHSESLSEVVSTIAEQNLTVSVSFTANENGAASMTLYRLSDTQLRFRFRVDRAEVRTKGGNLVQVIPAIEFPSMGANILAKFVDHEIARQLRDYTTASLGFASSRVAGKRVILEYVINPQEPEQMAALIKALRGDLRELVRVAWRLASQQATDESTKAFYRSLMAEHDAVLGPATYGAMNEYNSKSKNWRLHLPILMDKNWNTTTGDDRMTRFTEPGGQFMFNKADKSRQSEYIDIPWVGPLFKTQVQRDVQVVTYAPEGQTHGEPMAVYLEQHGFLRADKRDVRDHVEGINEILNRTGTRGRGINRVYEVPLDAFTVPAPAADPDGRLVYHDANNQKGVVSFTLAFNQKAIREILSTSAEEVVRAFSALVSDYERPMMDWLLGHATFSDDGKVEYDWGAARRAFPGQGGRDSNDGAFRRLQSLARTCGEVVTDLYTARMATDNEARAAAVARLMSGKGESGLAYDDIIKVLIQLVDPKDVTGDFYAHVDRSKKDGGDANLHLQLKKNRPENELLRAASAAKSRFAEPSILVD